MPQKHKTIIFNGPPESGKDEAAKLLMQSQLCSAENTELLKFSLPLQLMLRSATTDFLTPYEDLKRKQFKAGDGRQIMIDSFIKVIEPILGEDWLGIKAAEATLETRWCNFHLITDGGRQAEVAAYMERLGQTNCIVVNVSRPGTTFEGDSRQPVLHPLETHHFKIVNDGTLPELKQKICEIYEYAWATIWR